jgi:hypothetical protein
MNKFNEYPEKDNDWSEEDWSDLIQHLVDTKMASKKEIASLVLGSLNPSQVGTSIASNKNFQKNYPPRKTWQAVRQWHFDQSGKCLDCETRLELQADHVIPKEELGDAADQLDNMALRCRRCNVIKRPSHKKGGLTFLTTESALMWILLTKKPTTYEDFHDLCREYGMTMANIRFEEAWAMAKWLNREGKYSISDASKY